MVIYHSVFLPVDISFLKSWSRVYMVDLKAVYVADSSKILALT